MIWFIGLSKNEFTIKPERFIVCEIYGLNSYL